MDYNSIKFQKNPLEKTDSPSNFFQLPSSKLYLYCNHFFYRERGRTCLLSRWTISLL